MSPNKESWVVWWCIVVVAHSLWTRNALQRSRYTFSLLFSYSLSHMLCGYIFLFFLRLYLRLTQLIAGVQASIFRPGRLLVLFLHLFTVYIKKKTAAWRVQWLVVIWQLHLMMKTRERRKIPFFFSSPLLCVHRAQCLRVVYSIHDNNVKSAQKISLDRMNKSSRLSMITQSVDKKKEASSSFFFC